MSNHNLTNAARIVLSSLFVQKPPKASKRRSASVDFSAPEQLELRKLLTATITDLTSTQIMGTNTVVITGDVQDDLGAAGLQVNFGGVLQGTSVGVDDDGSFQYVLDDAPEGVVTAQTYSWDGTASNVAQTSV